MNENLESESLPYVYSAYGLSIQSDLALPGFARGKEPADVSIRRGRVRTPALQETSPGYGVALTETRAYLKAQNAAVFEISEGRTIVYEPAEAVDGASLVSYLTGGPLGLLLRQRGLYVLHGSAIVVDGEVVGFTGGSGWGKSTMVAALHQRGFPFFCDDLIAIQPDGGEPLAFAGPGRSSLSLEATEATGATVRATGNPRFNLEKNGCAMEPLPAGTALPLRAFYILGQGDRCDVSRLTTSQAMLEMVAHTYGAITLKQTRPKVHFHHCATIAACTPVYRFLRPVGFDRLDEVVTFAGETITRDADRVSGAAS